MTRKLLLGALVVVLLGLVGAEVWLRASIHAPPADWPFVWDPLLADEYRITEEIPGLAPRTAHVTTNALGLRGPDADPAAPGDVVLTLGGSVTECLLLDDGDTWPARLQARLPAGGPTVLNGGRSGQATVDYTLHALEVVPRLRPSLVLAMPGANDLQAAMEERYFPVDLDDPAQRARMKAAAYPSSRAETIELLRTGYLRWMLARPRSSRDITGFYRTMKERRGAAPKLTSIPDLALLESVYAANLRLLVEAVARTEGTELVLLTHPHLWKPRMSEAEAAATWGGYTCMNCATPRYYAAEVIAQALGRLNGITRAVCAETGTRCIDVDAGVPRTLEHFYDGAHLTAAGADRVAAVVAEALEERR